MDDYFHNTVGKFYMNCGRNGRWKRVRPAGVLKGKLPICKKKKKQGKVNRVTGKSLYLTCHFLLLLLNNLENIKKGICKTPFRNDRGNFQSHLLPFASCSVSVTAKHKFERAKN